MTTRPSLSAAGRAWAIERVLSHVQGRYVEQLAQTAPTEEEGIKLVRRDCTDSGGIDRFGHRWNCLYKHIEVEYPDGTAGIVTWREVVRSARAAATQLVLL